MPEASLTSRALVLDSRSSATDDSGGNRPWFWLHLSLAVCWASIAIALCIHVSLLGGEEMQIRRQRGDVNTEMQRLSEQQQRLSAHLDIITSQGRMRQLLAESKLPQLASLGSGGRRD